MWKSLLKPAAYPEPTTSVHLLQTHVSYIFLTDLFVYKVKKAVDFGFLNFSTLDRRRFYCEEEVRLNRRLAPDLYLGVVELRETESGFAFSGTGKIVDYAVKMRRLPEEKMLHHLLDVGEVSDRQITDLAITVARFHLNADTGEEITRYGSPEVIRSNWDENFRMARGFVGFTLSDEDLQLMENWVSISLDRNRNLFLSRMRNARIRDCDGDLHTENICIDGDRVYIFDCIEFNDRFRYSDTAADVAFLVMDLDYHGREDLADIFLQAYERESGDSFRELLPFYKAYRAFVRGKVESLKARDQHVPDPARNRARREAQRHFRLARRYVLAEKLSPSLIITCGLMGSGKSYLAKNLGFDLGISVIRTDAVRKDLFIGSESPLGVAFQGGIYSPEATEKTYEAVFKETASILGRGRSVIVDATFGSEHHRAMFRDLARQLGVAFHVVQVGCPENVARRRLIDRSKTGADISDGRWELYHQQKRDFSFPAVDDPAIIPVDTTQRDEDVITTVLKKMRLIT